MRNMHATVYTAASLIMAVVSAPQVRAVEVTVASIVDPAIAAEPFVHGSTVIWEDFVSGRYKFMSYELYTGETKTLTDNGAAYHYPYVYGGSVVAWIEYAMQYGGGGGGGGGLGGMPKSTGQGPISPPISWGAKYFLMAFNISANSTVSLTQDAGYKECLAADGSRVAWADYRHFSPGDTTVEIYLSDAAAGGGELRVTNHTGYKADVAMTDDRIVWQDYRNKATTGINADIFMCTVPGGQETAICTEGSYQAQPDIDGNVVVWQDFRNAGTSGKNADIYLYDITAGEERPVCTNEAYQENPRISGNFIVWQDYRNVTTADTGNADIYLYDLSTGIEQAIVTKPGYQGPPSIYGNKVVWYDYTDGRIYLAQIGAADAGASRAGGTAMHSRIKPEGRVARFDIRGRTIRPGRAHGMHIIREDKMAVPRLVVLRR